VCARVCVYVCMRVYMCVCVCICVYACVEGRLCELCNICKHIQEFEFFGLLDFGMYVSICVSTNIHVHLRTLSSDLDIISSLG